MNEVFSIQFLKTVDGKNAVNKATGSIYAMFCETEWKQPVVCIDSCIFMASSEVSNCFKKSKKIITTI